MNGPRRGGAGRRGGGPRPHRRAALRAGLLAGLALLVLAGAAGCSAASRQGLVEALFDDPPSKRRARAEEQARAAAEAPRRQTGEREVRRAVWQGSQHGPFAARLCQACHVSPTGENPAPGAEVARLRHPVDSLCTSCHAPSTLAAGLVWKERVRWHGPVAAGLCVACHLPHRSREVRLLRAPPERICLNCHAEGHLVAAPLVDGEQCLDCHDPHAPQMAGLAR